MKTATHSATVWSRDLRGAAWAWSCVCGQRFTTDLPDQATARSEAHRHCAAANHGSAP